MKHKHDWKIVDYDDCDYGIIDVRCSCGQQAKATTNLDDKIFYSDPKCATGYEHLLYLPELDGDVEELMEMDAKAVEVKL